MSNRADRDEVRGRPFTYGDLKDEIVATGEIPVGMVAAMARRKARLEAEAMAKLGFHRAPAELYRGEHAKLMHFADCMLASERALQETLKQSPHERSARTCELQAEKADSEIPPRPDAAARFRALAAEYRAADPTRLQIAAE